MVRIPSLSRRSEPTESAETAVRPGGATTTATDPAPPGTAAGDRADREAASARADREHARRSAEHADAQRAAAERAADRAETQRIDAVRTGRDESDRGRATGTAVADPATRPVPPGPRPEPPTREETGPRPAPPPAPAGPRPRASLLATLSLFTGVVGALFVLSGALAPYGIAIGVASLAFGLGGISATARRHIAGRTEALIGIALALGTMLVGSLALTGSLSWLTTEMDTVSQLRQWLDSQFTGIF